MSLSERIRPGVEAAPWVVEEVRRLEVERDRLLAAAVAFSDYVDGEGFATDGPVRFEYGAVMRHAFRVRAAIAACNQPPAATEPAPVTYSHDDGSGEFFVGSFPTPEDAAADALSETDAESVDVGENRKHPASHYVSGVWIIEDVAQRAYDECGEAAEDWLSGLARDCGEIADLERLVGDWIERREPPGFWEVANVRTISRAELVVSGHLDPED